MTIGYGPIAVCYKMATDPNLKTSNWLKTTGCTYHKSTHSVVEIRTGIFGYIWLYCTHIFGERRGRSSIQINWTVFVHPKTRKHKQNRGSHFYQGHFWTKGFLALSQDDVLTRQGDARLIYIWRNGYGKPPFLFLRQPLSLNCTRSNTGLLPTEDWPGLRTDATLSCFMAEQMYSRQGMEGFALQNPWCPAISIRALNGRFITDASNPI
mgnify:CR=1 FL=1